MNTKTFPKSRICVIDVYPSFEQGIKKAVNFALKHDIHLNTLDGQKVIIGFCIEHIEEEYKNTTSPYPKVLCMGYKARNSKLESFIVKHFDKIVKFLPFPYCGKILMESPDLEAAAENCLKQQKSQRKFGSLVKKLNLRRVN